MKGYKAFNKDLTCHNMQYEIGNEYTFNGEPIPCQQGFHFCKSIVDCYEFYEMSDDTRICEIIASGDIKTDDEIKYCTNKIKIVREVKNPRAKTNTSASSSGYCNSGYCDSGDQNSGNQNSGDGNSGNQNSGDYNSGNRNSGNWNSGNRNSGDFNSGKFNSGNHNPGYWNSGNCNLGNWNSGNWNSGDYNSGNRNSGDCNLGDFNSGNRNSGNCNSGDWNSGHCNSGIFNTNKNPKIKIFDADSNWTMNDWTDSKAFFIMSRCPCTHSEIIYSPDMSDEEKENHPEYKTIGGYVKTIFVTDEDKQKWWDALSSDERQVIYKLPNFDAEKFKMCTGITVNESEIEG